MEMRKVGPPALGEGVADRLLDLLSTDDAFRALFVRDAKAAMEMAGYVHADETAAHPGFCYVVTNLASKPALNSIQNFTCPDALMGA